MPRQVSKASTATNTASKSTNQAAIIGTNAPKRSNWDCIRLSRQDHARAHELGSERHRSDDEPTQRLDILRLSRASDRLEAMATKRARLTGPPVQCADKRS